MASCTVATPKPASAVDRGSFGAHDVAFDDSELGHAHLPFCFNAASRRGKHAPGIALVDLESVFVTQDLRRLDIALGVVVVIAGLGIDATHCPDHLGCKQDVLDRDHGIEQVDARLVIDAGVEIDVVQQMFLQQRLLQFLRQTTEAAPVVGHGASAVRDQETQGRKLLEQIGGQALHEGRGVGIEVVRPGGVETRVAAGRHMDHGRNVVLDHLLVDRDTSACRSAAASSSGHHLDPGSG